MNIEVRMAIMSHLSDAQEIGIIAANTILARSRTKLIQEQSLHINFAKRLLIKYKDNINQEISEETLDTIWKEICTR